MRFCIIAYHRLILNRKTLDLISNYSVSSSGCIGETVGYQRHLRVSVPLPLQIPNYETPFWQMFNIQSVSAFAWTRFLCRLLPCLLGFTSWVSNELTLDYARDNYFSQYSDHWPMLFCIITVELQYLYDNYYNNYIYYNFYAPKYIWSLEDLDINLLQCCFQEIRRRPSPDHY